jgi:drug/metabolite transporter (DMT)-like permease
LSLTVFFAVLFAAFMHAAWNALIKFGPSKLTSMLILTVVQGAMGAVVVTTRALPQGEVWLWLLASGVFHSVYKVFLSFAYEHGDLSRVYPIARGAAPLMVLAVGFVALSDSIKASEYIGILVLGAGILLMARGVFANGESRRLVPLALGSAMSTAGYSLVDGLGARVSGDAATYVAWLFIFDALFFTPVCLALRGVGVMRASRMDWLFGSIGGALSYGAYSIAVWAMTITPIALVAALRETSILFAVIIGVVVFRERIDLAKVAAAGLIVFGVILTRF